MVSHMSRALRDYGIAVLLTAAATAVVFLLNVQFSRSFYSTIVIAVILSAWIGGLGPALLSSVVSVLAINYFFQPPRYQLSIGRMSDVAQLAIFAAAAVLISFLTRGRDLARAEAGQATRQALHEESLAELARQGAVERDIDRVIQLICQQAVALTGADYAGIRLLDEAGHGMWRGMWGNKTDAWRQPRSNVRSVGASSRAIEANRPVVCRVAEAEAAGELHPHSVRVQEAGVVEIGAPLQVSGRTLGAIIICWRSDVTPTEEHIRTAEVLAGYAAAVLDNVMAHEETERRRLEAEALAELVQRGAAERDPDLAVALICQQGCRILGADYSAVLMVEHGVRVWRGGYGLTGRVGVTTRGRANGPARRAMDAGHSIVLEGIRENPDLSLFHATEGGQVAICAPCIGNGDFQSVVHFGWRRDVAISARHQRLAEAIAGYAAVILDNARGNAALQEWADTVRIANEQLMRVDEMKNNLISNVSHELRTPLSSIRAFSELLLDDDIDEPTRAEFTQIINEESERLSRLVSNLLDLSRIQARGIAWQFRSLDARRELELAVAALRPAADKKNLDLRVEIAADVRTVVADPDGLQQALVNLIANAVKFTSEGEIVVGAARENGSVRLSVTDSGPGMDEHEQARVFERFYQAGNMLTSKPSGTGLGLAITKEILLQHGTDIRLDSAPERGSSFSFVLPATIESDLVAQESRP